jgi:hypothetical protein
MPLPPRVETLTLNPELERLDYQFKVVREELEGLIWGLSDDQVNWTPEPGRWSIAQCIDHLNITNLNMITSIDGAIKRGRAAGVLHDGPYVYGFLSRWFMQLMQPPVKRKFKAPAKFQPAPRKSLAELLTVWERTHDRYSGLLREANGLDLAGIKLSSPAIRWIKYPVGIAFWIAAGHDRRHLWQARQVRNDPGFPEK